mmetsp:Transcript_30681/g.5536  ORF Transcript_30681/g.5536 Transcript_30681/m.5536 type:complete len:87 (+) Transcript_30681:221-481(+)
MFSITLLSLLSATFAQKAGLRVGVNDSAINSAKDELLPILMKNINSITIPDIHDTLGPKILNNSVSLTNIKIGDFKVDVKQTNLDF